MDTVAPVVTIRSPACGWRYRDSNLVLDYSVSEGSAEVRLDGAVVLAPAGSTLGPLDVKKHTVEVQATDGAANKGSAVCSFEITNTHCGDWNYDRQINLSELLRGIQFFNGVAYHCDSAGEDGYAPGSGSHDCQPHDADYQEPRWSISLSELLRLIQLYNSAGFHMDATGEDGFALGL